MVKEEWHQSSPNKWRTLTPAAKEMRRQPTKAEDILWKALRNNSLDARFRRQHPVDRFIADLCCLKSKLIVEVDGPIHQDQIEQDQVRDLKLSQLGFRILRFTNDQVLKELPEVIRKIEKILID